MVLRHMLFSGKYTYYKSASTREYIKKWQNVFASLVPQKAYTSTVTGDRKLTINALTKPIDRNVKISKAMKAYLDRAQQHDDFIKEQTHEYEMGRRHLANMMGVDENTFTQRDIDEAICYLMPSGLFDKKARPMMKHPKDLFPKRKAAEFDATGRPFSSFFYTGNPNYYETLFQIVDKLQELDDFEDTMIKKGIQEPLPETRLELEGSEWTDYDQFQKVITEEVTEFRYNYFIISISQLAQHPYAFRCKAFIMKFRKLYKLASQSVSIQPLTVDENGRTYAEARGARKKTTAQVTVFGSGSGEMKINGEDIDYFPCIQQREQLLFPLQFTGFLNQVDVVAKVTTDGGSSCQAGAIRHGISIALKSFVDTNMVEKMRIAGLLTRDPRMRERKKPGQEGARRKFTWKKR